VQHHFVHATGLSHTAIRQIERARQAASLLRQGQSIADVMGQAGYYDQPHLTRAVKRFTGQTPVQLSRELQPA
jgi:AraC-like DNA-binding protein